MAKLDVPFLVAVQRNGRTWFYWQPSSPLRREGWKPRRLADELPKAIAEAQAINAELDSWRQARAGLPVVAPAPAKRARPRVVGRAEAGTVDELIAEYKRSEFWSRLKPKTRRSYEQCLTRISDWAGDAPRHAIVAARVQALYRATKKATPAFAAAIVRVGQAVWSRGRLLGLVKGENPWARQALEGGGRTGLAWPREAVDWIVAVADAMDRPSIGTAVLLNNWIGQRQADVLRLPRTILASGGTAIRQRKTGAVARLPVHVVPELAARIEAQIADVERRGHAATTLLVDETTGRPWQEDTFRHVFAEIRAEAERMLEGATLGIDWLRPGRDAHDEAAFRLGLGELQFMHLRHTAVVRLNEAGVDLLGIAAITGHSPRTAEQILEVYGIKTGRAAGEAFKRRLAHEAAGKGEG